MCRRAACRLSCAAAGGRRVGTADMKATVTLEVDCRPHRFLCSPQLMAVAGLAAGTRPRVLQVAPPLLPPAKQLASWPASVCTS